MRLATILALVLLPLTALSQPCDPAQTTDVCPDTTDWRRYFPLEVGNSWQYRETVSEASVTHWSWRIIDQTQLGGQTYFALERCDETEDGGAACAEPVLIRYDEDHAMLVRRDGEAETWWAELPCRLDVAFHEVDEGEVYACAGPGTEGMSFAPAEGAYGASVIVPPDEITGDTRKRFSQLVAQDWELYAGLGATRFFYELQEEPSRLVYAFVGGRQFGTPAFAACDPSDPVLSHVPCPDTTDWRRYYPLEVGNEWQYESTGFCGGNGVSCWTGHQIVGIEEIDGVTYYLERGCSSDPYTNEISCGSPYRIRYDDEARTVVGFALDGTLSDALGVCRLDLPFNFEAMEVDCLAVTWLEGYLAVYGWYGSTFSIDGGPSVQGSLKGVYHIVGGTDYFAGIGMIRMTGEIDHEFHLRYAHVGGVTYGTPIFAFPTSGEPGATAPAASKLGPVHPNPVRSALTVAYELAAPQDVTLEVVDVLGRRVRTLDLGARPAGPSEARIEAAGLAPGLYVVRLLSGGEVIGTRRVTVVR